MKNYFIHLSKLCIGVLPVPQEILDKLVEFHTEPMNAVREELGLPVYASQESGFRPYIWEIARGRSGTSKHCFGQQSSGVVYKHEKGAVDWTCENFANNVDKFLKLILKHTKYTRIAIYKGFIHCDYGATDGKRYIYRSTVSSKWTLKEILSF